MDCEKFEQHLMDALYDELDELTHAAFKRHMDGCSRCSSTFAGLRATRDVGVLPLEEPSAGLEDRILAAALAAQQKTPWHRKALRVLAWAGSHAMRPQLAMAALFVLVIGSSLLLLRPKSMLMPAPVRVTERGVPAPDTGEAQPDPAMLPPVAAAEPPAAATASPMAAGAEEKAKRETEAEGKGSDAKAALAEARAVRQKSGCGAAVKAYDEVGARFPATVVAAEAMWEAADCYKTMGDSAKARELYQALRSYASYRDRAEAELNDASGNAMNNAQMASRSAAGAPAPPAAAPQPVAAAGAKAAKKPAAEAQASKAPQASPAATAPGGGNPPMKPAAPAPAKQAPAAADAYGF
jgi:hypothetical protein